MTPFCSLCRRRWVLHIYLWPDRELLGQDGLCEDCSALFDQTPTNVQ